MVYCQFLFRPVMFYGLFKIFSNSFLLNFLFLSLSNAFIFFSLNFSNVTPGCELKTKDEKKFNFLIASKTKKKKKIEKLSIPNKQQPKGKDALQWWIQNLR